MNNENDKQPKRLEVYLHEYSKLKDEQTQRIGFRDNLLYVTLVAFGAILSFALSQKTEVASKAVGDVANNTNYYALLVIPWVCLILGWAYLVNDQKISALGKYIREDLRPKINPEIGKETAEESTFYWEIQNRNNPQRQQRKIKQLVIDEITFVISGLVALIAFWKFICPPSPLIIALIVIEGLLLLVLGWEIFSFARGEW